MTIEQALIAVAALAAAVAILAWRRAEGRERAAREQIDSLATEREDLTARLSRERQARAKQSDELATLRKRADKVKKRSARAEKGPVDLPLGTAARIGDLEAQITRVERERDRSRAEREQLASQVADLEARLELARRPAPLPELPGDVPPAVDEAVLAEAREQIGKLENQLELARQSEARMRKRMSNQEQLYASIRSELEVKKDRLRAQEEKIQRLQALEVAVKSD